MVPVLLNATGEIRMVHALVEREFYTIVVFSCGIYVVSLIGSNTKILFGTIYHLCLIERASCVKLNAK